jgi:glutathione peroxidase
MRDGLQAIFIAGLFLAMTMDANAACTPLLDRSVNNLMGGEKNLCDYRGKVVLVVNTASKCGYTGQYVALEALYKKYKNDGLVVLGFPSNDFGAQEPGANNEVANFCQVNYGVTFPMFEKTPVKDAGKNPFYDLLANASGERPKWNFHKYLIGRDGKTVKSFASAVEPVDAKLITELENLLAQKP